MFVPHVVEVFFMSYIKPELMNEIDFLVSQLGRMRSQIKILNLIIRPNYMKAKSLLRLR